jgi:hypothetical protein
MGDPHRAETGRDRHTDISVRSLDAPALRAFVARLSSGESIELLWQFKRADLARQAGLPGLRKLCTGRKIGFQIICFTDPAAREE